MSKYVGLDVSQKETEICVVDAEGRRVWRGKCRTDPNSILVALREHADGAVRIGMETGPLSIWLWHDLRAAGLDVDCIHARRIAAALSLQVNKTDANDAYGIAQVVRSGWYRPVAVKSLASCRVASNPDRARPAGVHQNSTLQPDPRLAEDLRGRSRKGERRNVREDGHLEVP